MKANEAPEKIYRRLEGKYIRYSDYKPYTIHFNDPKPIEYTRTDFFIKKASEWLTKHARKYYFKEGCLGTEELVEDFKISMEL